MNGYTQNGDAGVTNLKNARNVSKADDRIRFLGDADELNGYLGLLKASLPHAQLCQTLEQIQKTVLTIQAGIADSYNTKYKIEESRLADLEREREELQAKLSVESTQILPGKNPISSQVDIARSVARRAERSLAAVSVKFGADHGAKRYLNLIGDYLFVLARYVEQENSGEDKGSETMQEVPTQIQTPGGDEAVIREVLRRIGAPTLTLTAVKRLLERVEAEALRRGKQAVLAVCNPQGNPLAVHVMDGAFLVSFDVALKKAYTSVAVKMSTMELAALAQPGQTFYGVDKLDGGKIVIFGGGIPLKVGETIIGGLGVSGGTAEEDHSLAEYAQSILSEVL